MNDAAVKFRLGKDIRGWFYYSGMSRAELARRLHVSPQYVTKLLSGRQNFTISQLCKIANIFHRRLRIEIL